MTSKNSKPETRESNPVQETDPLAALESAEAHSEVNVSSRTREIDDRVKRFVDRGFTLWQEKPRGKWAINVGSPKAVKEVTRDARAYARSKNLNFRVFSVAGMVTVNDKDVPAENALVYRVSAKQQAEEKSADEKSAEK